MSLDARATKALADSLGKIRELKSQVSHRSHASQRFQHIQLCSRLHCYTPTLTSSLASPMK